MTIANTLRLLTKATGMTATDLATAIPRAGAATVSAWLKGEKTPAREQVDALARTFGVPAGALLAELASTLDPARTQGEHALLASYRARRRPGRSTRRPCSRFAGRGRRRERRRSSRFFGSILSGTGPVRRWTGFCSTTPSTRRRA